ncbi:MAG: thrombospondin type 3 repeat-containing protein [Dehalococcoidia bacterium]
MSGTYKRGILGIAGAMIIATIAILALQGNGQLAHANHTVEFGVDVNSSGNTATVAGTVDTCRVVSLLQTFDVDIIMKNITGPGLVAFEAYFQYDPAKLQIMSGTIMFQSAQAGSSVTNTSEVLPDSDVPGIFRVGGVETAQFQGDIGSGVMIRLSVKALANGTSYAKVTKIDSDGDGVADFGIILRDANADLIGDTADADPFFDGTTHTSAIIIGTGSCTGDTDSDGVVNAIDNCPTVANANQANWDGDALGDVCDDSDGDGLMDSVDNCKAAANANQANMDGDALGDVCDPDQDGDGAPNTTDNCLGLSNPTQANMDGDAFGDACDTDIDGDNYLNTAETFMTTNPNMKCPANTGANNEIPDAWPPDFDDNRTVNISDVLFLKAPFGKSQGQTGYLERADLNQSLTINISDVLILKPIFLSTCTP